MTVPAAVLGLLRAQGVDGPLTVTPLAGGANNRVFRVDGGGAAVLLKEYFRHPGDAWDRLAVEYGFVRLAWEHGVRSVPEPLGCDPASGCALYEFIEGQPPPAREVGEKAVRQALGFWRDLNRPALRAAARKTLGAAAEACFSLAAHLAAVDRRLARLSDIPGDAPVDREAAAFVNGELRPAWLALREKVEAGASGAGLSLHGEVPQSGRVLSPSDFGFHNALVTAGGELRFVDFEYAGWDDPAKLVCDFFCQPQLPAPPELLPGFAEAVTGELADPALERRRVACLLPVYRLKWCTIVLNDFLPLGSRRRAFAAPGEEEARKRGQLAKARRQLAVHREGRRTWAGS